MFNESSRCSECALLLQWFKNLLKFKYMLNTHKYIIEWKYYSPVSTFYILHVHSITKVNECKGIGKYKASVYTLWTQQ